MREMKDSGIEWIGEIPNEWKLIQVKYLFKIGRGRVIAQTELEEKGEYPVYSSQTRNDGCLGYIDTYDFDRSQLTWTTDGANAGTVFLREGRHNCTNVCGTLQPLTDSVNLKFQKYALEYIAFYHKRADTNGFKIMNNEMATIHTVCPSSEEQKKIADYLDEKCSKIDTWIEKQQTVIEKLKEYKLSVITEAVTLKNNWKAGHLGYLTSFKNGLNYNGDSEEKEIKFLGVGDFKQHFILNREDMFSTLKFSGDMPDDLLLKNGDIVFVRSNGSKELVGRSVLIDNVDFPLTYSGFCIRMRNLRQDLVLNEFLMYCFWSNDFRQKLNRDSRGSNINNLNQELLSKLWIAFPDMIEQKRIVNILNGKCVEIEKIISNKEKLISKLIDYKKSLIYEIVTGKKEV